MSDGGTQIKLAAVDKLATWLSSQPITNVLLIMQLALIAGGGYGTLKYIVPEHLRQIQEGYERLDREHAKQIETIDRSREKENARAFDIIEKMMDQRKDGAAAKPDPTSVVGKDTPL
jgi:thymidylate kinase